MTLYLIKKGWNYSVNVYSFLYFVFRIALPIKLARVKGGYFFNHDVTFMFGEGCDQVADQINKLYGLTLGWFVHKNSVRVGWKWDADFKKVNLYAYYYLNGVRKWVYLCNVDSYREYVAKILKVGDTEIQILICGFRSDSTDSYLIGGTTIDFKHFGKNFPSIKWKLYPYFGGEERAKQDVRIYLKEK